MIQHPKRAELETLHEKYMQLNTFDYPPEQFIDDIIRLFEGVSDSHQLEQSCETCKYITGYGFCGKVTPTCVEFDNWQPKE